MAAIIGNDGSGITRHTSAAPRPGGYLWTCARCGTEHGRPLELGCSNCGAGTAEENNRAVAEVRAHEALEAGRAEEAAAILRGVTVPEMVAKLTTREAQGTVAGAYFLDLPALTPAARLTVASALAFYAEQAAELTSDEIPRGLALAWGQHLSGLASTEPETR